MKVKFIPQNIELDIEPNQSVMKLAHEKGIYIKSVCGGLPSCSECRVRVTEGEQNVLPPSTKELNLIGTGYFIDQRRLSCQLKCFGDVVIDLTEQIAKQATDGPKRPQGSKKEEHEASFAVSGNLIQQDDTLKKVAEEVANNPNAGRPQQQNRQGGQGGQGGGRNNNRRGRGGGGSGQNRNAQGGGQNQGGNQGRQQQQGPRPQQQGGQQQGGRPQQQGQGRNPNQSGGQGGQPGGGNQNQNRNQQGGGRNPNQGQQNRQQQPRNDNRGNK